MAGTKEVTLAEEGGGHSPLLTLAPREKRERGERESCQKAGPSEASKKKKKGVHLILGTTYRTVGKKREEGGGRGKGVPGPCSFGEGWFQKKGGGGNP